MNMYYSFLLFLIIFFGNFLNSFSQNYQFPANLKSVSQIVKELPKNLDTTQTLQADFNKDGFLDFVVILTNTIKPIKKETPVYLLIYFGNSSKMYTLHTTSTTAVLPLSFGKDLTFPFSGMTFEKGKLSIFHYYGEEIITSIEDTYLYKDNGFMLTQSSNSIIERDNDMLTTTEVYNWQKGIKEVKKNNYHQNFKTKTSKFSVKTLTPITKHIPGTIY